VREHASVLDRCVNYERSTKEKLRMEMRNAAALRDEIWALEVRVAAVHVRHGTHKRLTYSLRCL
jgi:hypothetical protein